MRIISRHPETQDVCDGLKLKLFGIVTEDLRNVRNAFHFINSFCRGTPSFFNLEGVWEGELGDLSPAALLHAEELRRGNRSPRLPEAMPWVCREN